MTKEQRHELIMEALIKHGSVLVSDLVTMLDVSAVTVRNANEVYFTNCTFQHLGATALDYESIESGKIEHCTFEDIGGTAILAGSFAESPREVHRPYDDLSDKCLGLIIQQNTIHDAANEDWGAVGIGVGYARDCMIIGNTVSHVNYSGICLESKIGRASCRERV